MPTSYDFIGEGVEGGLSGEQKERTWKRVKEDFTSHVQWLETELHTSFPLGPWPEGVPSSRWGAQHPQWIITPAIKEHPCPQRGGEKNWKGGRALEHPSGCRQPILLGMSREKRGKLLCCSVFYEQELCNRQGNRLLRLKDWAFKDSKVRFLPLAKLAWPH